MKRYIIFAYDKHKQFGGVNDIVCCCDNLESVPDEHMIKRYTEAIDLTTGICYTYDKFYGAGWQEVDLEIT